MSPPLVLCGLAILALAAGRIALRRRRQTRDLRDLAGRKRLNFSTEDLIGVQHRYHNLDLIRRGHSRHVCNVLYGSTEAGLATLFCYSYDLGFGQNRCAEQRWIAVVETSQVHDHWHAVPSTGAAPSAQSATIDRFVVHSAHQETLQQLENQEIRCVFREAPPDYLWEARGPFIAVAMPLSGVAETPEGLLATACRLASLLADATPAATEK